MPGKAISRFYDGVPRLSDFAEAIDTSIYKELPDGWIVGLADIVDSTGAIAAGRCKAHDLAQVCDMTVARADALNNERLAKNIKDRHARVQ